MDLLGVTAEEEELYRHFLRHPHTSVDDVCLLFPYSPEEVRAVLARLRDRRMICWEGEEAWANDPEVVVPWLAEEKLQLLHEQMRLLVNLQPVIDALRSDGPAGNDLFAPGVSRLTGMPSIQARMDHQAFTARTELLRITPYDTFNVVGPDHIRPLDMRCLRRGVRVRNLVRPCALRHPTTAAYLRETTAAGAEVRVSDSLSEIMLIYDRQTALIPVNTRDASGGALLVREAGLVTTIVNQMERLWESGYTPEETTPAGAGGTAGAADAQLTQAQIAVLRAMCTASKDEVGARAAGMSLRTYRRHIADLIRRTGAENRVQAMLLARESGWI
ncbi:hypothetical protein [Streptomyces sp. NRRL F-5123]|uniref:hypothetical protein n=1 Tax=Streptomyces sp. NRRL F-5123 TaxID=1463856 RepID=UPI0004E226C1|nr:hypothetical protein [Streptomyces sp. NRRL F-5123]